MNVHQFIVHCLIPLDPCELFHIKGKEQIQGGAEVTLRGWSGEERYSRRSQGYDNDTIAISCQSSEMRMKENYFFLWMKLWNIWTVEEISLGQEIKLRYWAVFYTCPQNFITTSLNCLLNNFKDFYWFLIGSLSGLSKRFNQ